MAKKISSGKLRKKVKRIQQPTKPQSRKPADGDEEMYAEEEAGVTTATLAKTRPVRQRQRQRDPSHGGLPPQIMRAEVPSRDENGRKIEDHGPKAQYLFDRGVKTYALFSLRVMSQPSKDGTEYDDVEVKGVDEAHCISQFIRANNIKEPNRYKFDVILISDGSIDDDD